MAQVRSVAIAVARVADGGSVDVGTDDLRSNACSNPPPYPSPHAASSTRLPWAAGNTAQ